MVCKAAAAHIASNCACSSYQRQSPSLANTLMGHLWPEDGAVGAELGGCAQQGSAYGGYALDKPHRSGIVGADCEAAGCGHGAVSITIVAFVRGAARICAARNMILTRGRPSFYIMFGHLRTALVMLIGCTVSVGRNTLCGARRPSEVPRARMATPAAPGSAQIVPQAIAGGWRAAGVLCQPAVKHALLLAWREPCCKVTKSGRETYWSRQYAASALCFA